MKKIVSLCVLSLLCAALFSACGKGGDQAAPESGRPIIAVSIVPEESFVKAVCGDLVETVVLVPPGSSPETYEPSPMQMESFSDAAIYFSIGVPTEATNILPSLSENTRLVSLSEACAAVYDERMIGSTRDPHIWLSPKRAVVMINTIAEEMSAFDRTNAASYAANAAAYIEEINAADAAVRNALDGLQTKKFIVFHPAFGYLADDYGLEMYALEEDGKEATAVHLQDMTDLAKKEKIKVVFYQAETDSSQSEAFAEEIGGVTAQLEPLSADYTENLKTMANTIAKAMSSDD